MMSMVKTLFDVVVVDEASQIITPNLVVFCLEALILSGIAATATHRGWYSGDSAATLFEAIAEHPERDTSLIVQLTRSTDAYDIIGLHKYILRWPPEDRNRCEEALRHALIR